MTLRLLLSLYLGGSLFLVSPPVFADDDDDDNKRATPTMQIMIDKKTGKKLERENDADDSPALTTAGITDTGRNSNISAMIPAKSQPPQYHADGSISAQIGFEHFKFLVATKDESGEPVVTHVPAAQVDAEELPDVANREEQ